MNTGDFEQSFELYQRCSVGKTMTTMNLPCETNYLKQTMAHPTIVYRTVIQGLEFETFWGYCYAVTTMILPCEANCLKQTMAHPTIVYRTVIQGLEFETF
jgi:hypothetical protein